MINKKDILAYCQYVKGKMPETVVEQTAIYCSIKQFANWYNALEHVKAANLKQAKPAKKQAKKAKAKKYKSTMDGTLPKNGW